MEDIHSFHKIFARDISRRFLNFEIFRDKVCILINLESIDTHADTSLKKLADFKKEDVNNNYEILIFPCKENLAIMYHKASEIQKRVCEYSDLFIVFDFVELHGSRIHPVYVFLSRNMPCWFQNGLRSNLTKFVVDGEGKVISKYSANEHPSHHDCDLRKYSRNMNTTFNELKESKYDNIPKILDEAHGLEEYIF